MTARSRRFKFIAKRADSSSATSPSNVSLAGLLTRDTRISHPPLLRCATPGQFQLKGTKSLAASLLSKGDRAKNISPNTGRSLRLRLDYF